MYGTHNAPKHRYALVFDRLDDIQIENAVRVPNKIGVKLRYGRFVDAESLSNTRGSHFFLEAPQDEQLLFFIQLIARVIGVTPRRALSKLFV